VRGCKVLFGGFHVSEDLRRVNFGGMNCKFFVVCSQKTLSHKQHTVKIRQTPFHSCVSRSCLDFGRQKTDEYFNMFETPSFLSVFLGFK